MVWGLVWSCSFGLVWAWVRRRQGAWFAPLCFRFYVSFFYFPFSLFASFLRLRLSAFLPFCRLRPRPRPRPSGVRPFLTFCVLRSPRPFHSVPPFLFPLPFLSFRSFLLRLEPPSLVSSPAQFRGWLLRLIPLPLFSPGWASTQGASTRLSANAQTRHDPPPPKGPEVQRPGRRWIWRSGRRGRRVD